MTVKLQSHLDYIDDFRLDNTSDTLDTQTEGIRALNFIINDLKQRHAWEFTLRHQNLVYYKDLHEYALPDSYMELKGVYDTMNYRDPFTRLSPIQFRRKINQSQEENLLSIGAVDGRLSLLINFASTKSVSVPFISCVSLDGDGLWTLGAGVGANLQGDAYSYLDNGGSLRVDSTGNGAIILQNSTMGAKDLSAFIKDYKNVCKIYMPDASKFTSISLIYGTSALDYHTINITAQANGRPFKDGINIIAFDIKDAVDTGTPSESTLSFVQVVLNVTGAMKSIRISSVNANTPDLLDLEYYADEWAYDFSVSAWLNQFNEIEVSPNEDYGAWSGGPYEWFANVVNLGTAWQVLLEMQEDDKAELYRVRYEGKDGNGGAIASAIKKLPSQIKKMPPPSISLAGDVERDYFV